MWKYPDEVIRFAAENVKGRRPSELSDLLNKEFGLNFTPSKVRALMKNHGLKNGLPKTMKGEGKKLLSSQEEQFILDNYKGTGHQAMADMLNEKFGTSYTKEQMKGYYARNKLDSGLRSRFTKGHDTWNKGKPKSWVGGEETQFKKGHIPVNYRPVGSERVSVDGYIEIKVADPNKWRLKHQVVWEEHNGDIPKGYVVIFGDSDKSNLDINNLILISRAQLARLNQNGLIQNDIELTKTGVVIAEVMTKIGERAKKQKG